MDPTPLKGRQSGRRGKPSRSAKGDPRSERYRENSQGGSGPEEAATDRRRQGEEEGSEEEEFEEIALEMFDEEIDSNMEEWIIRKPASTGKKKRRRARLVA